MKTIIEIAADLAPHCAVAVPQVLVASSEQSDIDMLRCLNEAGKELQTRFDWPEMRKNYTQNGAGDTPLNLPSDYSRMVNGWAVTSSAGAVRGSLSDEEFNRLEPVAGVPRYFRTSGTQISFWPYMDIGSNVSMIYISRNWLSNDQDEIIADDASPLFSDELLRKGAVWRFKRMKGQDFKDWLDEFEADLKAYSTFSRSERLP